MEIPGLWQFDQGRHYYRQRVGGAPSRIGSNCWRLAAIWPSAAHHSHAAHRYPCARRQRASQSQQGPCWGTTMGACGGCGGSIASLALPGSWGPSGQVLRRRRHMDSWS